MLVINSNRYREPMPVMPVGACVAAEAAERAGHAVRLLDLTFSRDPLGDVGRELAARRPDLVGISVRNIDNGDMAHPVAFRDEVAAVARTVREGAGCPIVLGGAAVGLMPEAWLRATGAEWAVVGDAETIFPRFLDALGDGGDAAGVPGVAWLRDGAFGRSATDGRGALAAPAAPDYARWLRLRPYREAMCSAPVQTKRGCDQRCVYCTYRLVDGQGVRVAPPASVAEAVERLVASGIRDVEFVDSVFNAPYEHALEVCERLAAAKTRARLQTLELNPQFVDDALFAAMERAGFVAAGITVESASDAALAGLDKGYGAEAVHRAAEVVRRHNVPCMWVFLLGGPGETEATVRETLDFASRRIRRGNVAYFNVGVRIYPGARLEQLAREQGLLTRPAEDLLEPAFYVSPELSPDWLAATFRRALAENPHFLGPEAVPLAGALCRVGHRLGLRPPLWRFTRPVRRLLHWLGRDPC